MTVILNTTILVIIYFLLPVKKKVIWFCVGTYVKANQFLINLVL